MGKFKNQSKWLWKDKEVQEDLLILKENYENLGLNFTLEDCYNLWFYYSESLAANWLHPSGVEDSLRYMDRILLKDGENESTKREVLEQQDKELNNLMDQYNKLLEERCLTVFDLVADDLKKLDYCLGLILTNDGVLEYSVITKEEISWEQRKVILRIIRDCDKFSGIRKNIYDRDTEDKDNIELFEELHKIIKEIWFER